VDSTPEKPSAPEPEDEFERVQRVRAGRQRAMLFAVVGAAVAGFAVFVVSGFLLPDKQVTEFWVAVGVALAVGLALRFFLSPKEREFDPLASSPRVQVSEEDRAAWRAMVDQGAAPNAESTGGAADDDVRAELREYQRRVRRLWAARLASALAGLAVSAVLIAIFRNVEVGQALPAFMGCIAAGTVTAVLLFPRLTQEEPREAAGPASAEERAHLERELGQLSSCTLSYERDLLEIALEYLRIVPPSRACKVVQANGVCVASVRESGGWATRLRRAGDSFEILTATGDLALRLEKAKGWLGGAWTLRDDSGPVGRVDVRLFGGVVAVPSAGEPTRFVRPWTRFVFPWTRQLRVLVRGQGRGSLVRAARARSAGAFAPARVEFVLPDAAGDAYRDRALLLAAAVLAV